MSRRLGLNRKTITFGMLSLSSLFQAGCNEPFSLDGLGKKPVAGQETRHADSQPQTAEDLVASKVDQQINNLQNTAAANGAKTGRPQEPDFNSDLPGANAVSGTNGAAVAAQPGPRNPGLIHGIDPQSVDTAALVELLAERLSSEARGPKAPVRSMIFRSLLGMVDESYDFKGRDLSRLSRADRQLVLSFQSMFLNLAESLPLEERDLKIARPGEAARPAAPPANGVNPDEGPAKTTPGTEPKNTTSGVEVAGKSVLDKLTRDELLKLLSARLTQEATEAGQKARIKPYVMRASLSLLDPRAEISRKELEPLNPEDRRLVLGYQTMFSYLGQYLSQADVEKDREHAAMAADLLSDFISKPKILKLQNSNLCRSVARYGVYETFGENSFTAGQEQEVIVYTELENVKSEQNTNKMYFAKLTLEVSLYRQSDGQMVDSLDPQTLTDESRSKRRDFHLWTRFLLRRNLPGGDYTLNIRVTDELGLTRDEQKVALKIGAGAAAPMVNTKPEDKSTADKKGKKLTIGFE